MSRTPKGSISHRQFFFTEKLPHGAYSVHPAYAPVEKIPVTIHDEPGFENIGLSSLVRLDDGTYRSYSCVRSHDQRVKGIAVWDSPDALEWYPHYLGQVERDGRDTNLVYFEGMPGDQTAVSGPCVLRLKDGRWRMYFWKHREGHFRYTIAESEDGLRWVVPDFEKPALFHPSDGGLLKAAEGLGVDPVVEQKLSEEQILRRKRLWTNDSTNVYYNDQLDRFECYTVWLHPAIPDRRVDVDNAPGLHRLIQRRFSDDGIHWSDAELIIWPDDRDPWDLQFYFLGVQWHEDWMIGTLGYYRVEDGQQSMDTDLCFSHDGYRWERPVRGGWIPRSESGTDSLGIYAGGAWVDKGDRWLTLFQATPLPHNSRIYDVETMGATFAKNRFVGLKAERTPGGFMTEPFFLSTNDIILDADIRGWLRAELCDVFGRKLPGFHLMDSVPIKGNSEAHVLEWKDSSVVDHRFAFLRLRFEFSDGAVYSVAF